MKLFQPILAGANFTDRLLASVGAIFGIALTILICSAFPYGIKDMPIIVAPLGASAVLAFAVPSSPLAQPWSIVGGNVISTLVGVACFNLIPDVSIAAGVAVGMAILLMSLLRCLHPPGGATALTAVIGSHQIHAASYGLALAPVGINSIALVCLAMIFHRLTGRSYPHKAAELPKEMPAGLHLADIDAAIADMHESFDINREDLDALLVRAEHHAVQRLERKGAPFFRLISDTGNGR